MKNLRRLVPSYLMNEEQVCFIPRVLCHRQKLASVQGGVVSDPMKCVKLGLAGSKSYTAVVKMSSVVVPPVPNTFHRFSSCLARKRRKRRT